MLNNCMKIFILKMFIYKVCGNSNIKYRVINKDVIELIEIITHYPLNIYRDFLKLELILVSFVISNFLKLHWHIFIQSI